MPKEGFTYKQHPHSTKKSYIYKKCYNKDLTIYYIDQY